MGIDIDTREDGRGVVVGTGDAHMTWASVYSLNPLLELRNMRTTP
jgi:hypothetical protein